MALSARGCWLTGLLPLNVLGRFARIKCQADGKADSRAGRERLAGFTAWMPQTDLKTENWCFGVFREINQRDIEKSREENVSFPRNKREMRTKRGSFRTFLWPKCELEMEQNERENNIYLFSFFQIRIVMLAAPRTATGVGGRGPTSTRGSWTNWSGRSTPATTQTSSWGRPSPWDWSWEKQEWR